MVGFSTKTILVHRFSLEVGIGRRRALAGFVLEATGEKFTVAGRSRTWLRSQIERICRTL